MLSWITAGALEKGFVTKTYIDVAHAHLFEGFCCKRDLSCSLHQVRGETKGNSYITFLCY